MRLRGLAGESGVIRPSDFGLAQDDLNEAALQCGQSVARASALAKTGAPEEAGEPLVAAQGIEGGVRSKVANYIGVLLKCTLQPDECFIVILKSYERVH